MNNLKTFFLLIINCVYANISYSEGVGEGSPNPAPYVTMSSCLIGANVCLSTFNTIQIIKGTERKIVPITGLFTGATQIAIGVGNYSDYKDMQGLSIVNIGLGTATMVLSAWNLISNKNPKEKKTSFNFYNFPTQDKSVGFAFTYTRRF